MNKWIKIAILLLAISINVHADDLIPLRICVGQRGTAYDVASRIFANSLRASGKFQVARYETNGSLNNLKNLHQDHCDIGFTRSDVLHYYNTLESTQKIIGNTYVMPLEDGTPIYGDPSKVLQSNEIFREYAQLLCNRSMNVDDIKGLKSSSKDYINTLAKKQADLATWQSYEAQYNRDWELDRRNNSKKNKLDDARRQVGSLKNDLARLESQRPTIFFVRDNSNTVGGGLYNSNESVFWQTLLNQDSSYEGIRIDVIGGQGGKSSQQTALEYTLINPNACFLNIDRVGTDTFLQELDTQPEYYNKLRVIELNDWDFNNITVNGVSVYSFVDLTTKSVFKNMRAKRPDATFFTGRSGVETLSMRTMIVSSVNWYNTIQYNPGAIRALQEAFAAIKRDPTLKDPLSK